MSEKKANQSSEAENVSVRENLEGDTTRHTVNDEPASLGSSGNTSPNSSNRGSQG